jgi:hypothetical protein
MIYIASNHVGTIYPMDHPRFCFHKWGATVTATNSAAGADPDWMDDGETWSQWQAGSSTVTVTLTFSETRSIDYIGLAAHDLDLAGSTLDLQIDTGAGFATVPGLGAIEPADDSSILFFVGPVDVDAVRIAVTGTSAPKIAVFQAGLSMELPRKCTYTALPISESEQTRYRTAQSIKGQVLGRSVEAAELGFTIDVANLSEAWRQETGINSWSAFTAHVRDTGPFFVASRPSRYADDVAYGVANDRPRFNRQLPNHAVSGQISLDFMGYKRP